MKRSSLVAGLACLAASSSAVAQTCSFGPGEVLGIVAYQCANCGFKRETPERPTHFFYAEPVVLEAKSPGVFRAGDIIEAVDGKPITTSAGAEQFTYPAVGDHTVSVRRGRDRQVLSLSISSLAGSCAAPRRQTESPRSPEGIHSLDQVESVEVFKGAAAIAKYGPDAANGVLVITTTHKDTHVPGDRLSLQLPKPKGLPRQAADPLIIIDGLVTPVPGGTSSGAFGFRDRFGFAVACEPSCTAATTKEGALHYTYFKYDGFPRVAAIRPNSPADKAGLKVGDLVTKVDGHSIGDEEGARILSKLDRQDTLSLTVRRGETEIVVRMVP